MPLKILVIGIEIENPNVDSVGCALEAPSLFDYDIVIADVDSALLPELIDKIPIDEYVALEEKPGKRFQRAIEKLSNEVTRMMEKGGVLICLMKPRRGISYGYASAKGWRTKYINNYNWIPIKHLDWHITSGSGRRIRISDTSSPFTDYLKMPQTHWTAYMIDTERLDVQNEKIALNDAGEPIAMQLLIAKGSIIFLPASEHANIGDILLTCAVRSFKKTTERPPPPWLDHIMVPDEDADRALLDELSKRVDELQTKYSEAISSFEEKTQIKKLLYEKDEPLRETVGAAFRELGFTVTTKDDKDWVASSDTGEAILEVTGSDGSIDIWKLRQLLDYLIDDYKETGVEKKAILVGNHFVNNPPGDRGEPFTEKVVGSSDVHSMCLLTTSKLYEIIYLLREGKIEADDIRRKLIETVGIFELDDP